MQLQIEKSWKCKMCKCQHANDNIAKYLTVWYDVINLGLCGWWLPKQVQKYQLRIYNNI